MKLNFETRKSLLFLQIVKDEIYEFINLPQINEFSFSADGAIEDLTYQIIEILKRLVSKHIKEDYKAIMQVIAYPKKMEENILIRSQSLWNSRTDDILSLEVESETLKFVIVIHGLIAWTSTYLNIYKKFMNCIKHLFVLVVFSHFPTN